MLAVFLPSTLSHSPDAVLIDEVKDQSGSPEIAPTTEPCGKLDAKPCTKPLEQPCECLLYLDEESGVCKSEGRPTLCPQRPYCGYDGGPICAFPYESPCDECNEVDGINAICVRNQDCERGEPFPDNDSFCK